MTNISMKISFMKFDDLKKLKYPFSKRTHSLKEVLKSLQHIRFSIFVSAYSFQLNQWSSLTSVLYHSRSVPFSVVSEEVVMRWLEQQNCVPIVLITKYVIVMIKQPIVFKP